MKKMLVFLIGCILSSTFIFGSYVEDFDAILAGKFLSSDKRVVAEVPEDQLASIKWALNIGLPLEFYVEQCRQQLLFFDQYGKLSQMRVDILQKSLDGLIAALGELSCGCGDSLETFEYDLSYGAYANQMEAGLMLLKERAQVALRSQPVVQP